MICIAFASNNESIIMQVSYYIFSGVLAILLIGILVFSILSGMYYSFDKENNIEITKHKLKLLNSLYKIPKFMSNLLLYSPIILTTAFHYAVAKIYPTSISINTFKL